MNNSPYLDLAPLVPLQRQLFELSADGWAIEDVGGIVRLQGPISTSPIAWPGLPALEEFAVRRSASGTRRGHEITADSVNGIWEITDLPDILPKQLFDPEEVVAATKVWERESGALASITLDWRVEIDLDLAIAVEGAKSSQLEVRWSAANLEKQFANEPIDSLSRLIPQQGRRTYLALDGTAEPAVFGAITVATLNGVTDTRIAVMPPSTPLPGEAQVRSVPTSSGTSQVLGDFGHWPLTSEALAFATCATTWGAIATSWTNDTLEFFGYKKVQFTLPRAWAVEDIYGASKLRDWAFGDTSPDRILALRQIISLYNEPPFGFVDEILTSSETIYLGLRSTAVVEAVHDARDIENRTRQAVQQSSQSSVDLAKSAGERLIAGLAAVGATAIANVTQVLTFDVTTAILAFIGGYFVVMFVLFLLVDFRAVGLPIKDLDSEVFVKSGFLRTEALKELRTSPLVEGARTLVLTTRISITTIYALIVAALAITVVMRWSA